MRSWNSGRNAFVGLFFQSLNLLLNFIVRTVFVHSLSSEYLGVSGLFTNVLSILNLAELGLGSAITFALYKPVAEKNEVKIKAIMYFYKKAYFLVGCLFMIFGLLLVPFLPYLMKENTSLIQVNFVYFLYLFQTVTSYWFFAYRSALLTANQCEYIITVVSGINMFFMSLVQITLLLILQNKPQIAFYSYVLSGIVFNILTNAILAIIVGNKYPYIKDKKVIAIPEEEKKHIYKNVFGLSLYKISSTINNSAGSLIISSFISVAAVGIYSNYLMIIMGISRIIGVIFNPLTASIGNLNVTEGIEKKEFVFNSLNFIYFWIYGFSSICLWVLFQPFIGGIWLNKNWILPNQVVFAMVMKFLIDGLLGAVIKYREASGLFWNTRWRYLFTVLINLFFSVFFVVVLNLGILGVILGSIVSELFVVLVDPHIVYKNIFKKSTVCYYVKYIKFLIFILILGGIIKFSVKTISEYTFFGFFIRLCMCLIIPNIVWYITYRKTPEFQYLLEILKVVVNKLKEKVKKV